MLDASPGPFCPFKPRTAAGCLQQRATILFSFSCDCKNLLSPVLWATTHLKAVQSIIWYQDSVLSNKLLVMHGGKKIKVFGVVSDSEHFPLPPQNICRIWFSVSGSRDQDRSCSSVRKMLHFSMQTKCSSTEKVIQRFMNKTWLRRVIPDTPSDS